MSVTDTHVGMDQRATFTWCLAVAKLASKVSLLARATLTPNPRINP